MSIPRGRLMGGVSSFAHLASIGAAAVLGAPAPGKPAKAKADAKPKGEDGAKPDDDGEDTQAAGSGEDTQASGGGEDTQAGAGADDDAKPDDEDEDPDSDPDACDDEDEMHGKSAAARARRRERARCAAIFSSRSAAADPVLAANLAFNSSMTRQEALKVLEGSRKPGVASGAGGREARNPALGPGGERSANSQPAISASWDVAMAKASGRQPSK